MSTTRRPLRLRKKIEIPSDIHNITDLIEMAQSGKRYSNINNEMLWRISAQLIELNDMIGMDTLKDSIFYHVIYYLLDLYIDNETDYLHTVILGPPGCGKCLAFGTEVLMYDGSFKCIQDIDADELVMGDDSTPRTVLSTCKGQEQMFLVKSSFSDDDADSFTVNKSHILTCFRVSDETTVDVSIDQVLANPSDYLGIRPAVFYSEEHARPLISIDPYIFGYLMASNYTMINNVIHTEIYNPELLEKVRQEIPVQALNDVLYGLTLPEDCIEYFAQSTFPPLLHTYSRNVLIDILKGIHTAIGYIVDNTHSRMMFDATRTPVYTIVKLICNTLGIEYTCETRKMNYTIHQHHADVYIKSIILDSSFIHAYDCKVQRQVTFPFEIVPLERGMYYGFVLDGNHRFILGNGIVTHNTTIAKIIGEMYKNMGILSSDGVFRIAKREDFIAEYLGQTAIKTKKLLESCIGGILFIDEVYALGPGQKDHDSFSKEAIDTLNVFLSEHSDSFCCIIAGYEEDIKNCFFSVNKGLERRFQWVHKIESYSHCELARIFIKIIRDIRWKKDPSITLEQIEKLFKDNPTLFKSYGGDIENLITKCKMAHAKRVINEATPQKFVITIADIHQAIELMKPNRLHTEPDHTLLYSMYM